MMVAYLCATETAAIRRGWVHTMLQLAPCNESIIDSITYCGILSKLLIWVLIHAKDIKYLCRFSRTSFSC